MNRPSIFLMLAAFLVPATTQAYYVEARTQNDGGALVPITYDATTPVEFRIASTGLPIGDGSEATAIEAAFATWQAVECSTLSFTRGADEAAPMARHWMVTTDRYILVYWSNDRALWDIPRVGFFEWAHDGNGTVIGSQIILNGLDHSWSTTGETDKMDVQAVVTAMIGRSLGITSGMPGNATYPVYNAGDDSKRTLGTDDVAAIQYLYGDGSCTPDDPEMVCTDTPGEVCPPPVMTMPGDGGTALPDGGTMPMPDTGPPPTPDGGTVTPPPGDEDDGCGCIAAGAGDDGTGPVAALLLFGLVALRRRRR